MENGVAYLDNEEGRHATAALRFCIGDDIIVTDGKGAVYECTIAEADNVSGLVSATVRSTECREKPGCEIIMYIGLCDRDKFEDLAEQCSALGAKKIVPLICRYCQNPWWQQWDKHEIRLRKKIIAGVKQSHNPWLTQCEKPVPFTEALCQCTQSLVLCADANGVPLLSVSNQIQQAQEISCFIGPPGGFAEDELAALYKCGIGVSLSKNRLRTELAATVMCSSVKMYQ